MKTGKEIKEQSMAKGFAVLSVASILVKILSLFFIPVIRSLMGGSAGYQVYYSAYQVFAFVYVLATAGLPVAISKVVTELTTGTDHRQSKRAFRIALGNQGYSFVKSYLWSMECHPARSTMPSAIFLMGLFPMSSI